MRKRPDVSERNKNIEFRRKVSNGLKGHIVSKMTRRKRYLGEVKRGI